MQSKFSIKSCALLMAVLTCVLVGGCKLSKDNDSGSNGVETDSSIGSSDNDALISSTKSSSGKEVSNVQEVSIKKLGLCFTEGHISDMSSDALARRFGEYTKMGIKTLRYETSWVSFKKGSWAITADSEEVLKSAVKAGLRLKVISPTIMQPQTWASLAKESKLVNQKGISSVNTISFWYDGIYEYTSDAINCQLEKYKELGLIDDIDTLVVDFGPAGEPLYPAAWTQTGNLENPDNESTSLWFYADNAVADFKVKMTEKYSTIQKANLAWNTSYASFDSIVMPKPGEVKGTYWEDIMTWYLGAKRTFIEKQIQVFQEAVNRHSNGRIKLILYMPGASFTKKEWDSNIASGTATFAMKIGSENEFIADMAKKYDCFLQFTGLPGIGSLKQVREYMKEKGYTDIPVFGENYADYASSNNPIYLYNVIKENDLAGIDYTFTKFLYEANGETHSSIYPLMERAVPLIGDYITKWDK